MDRYAYSGVVYTAAKGWDLEWCMKPDEGLPKPDVVFYLDTSQDVLCKRSEYGREVYEKRDFQELVQQKYHELAQKLNTNHKWIKIDTNQEIQTVHHNICHHFNDLLVNSPQTLQVLW
ncbi:Thymidylate kinase [Thelohanellus kitauei]|uniref:Thymidylate kinase n=1 Tax=Thelohanellus kitauei TaxID=669202 RepID=A0A0C2N0F4_THEKT|nr:Thymidylate kinase [Thelohanellus kitauei]